jgi:hypothetical protein
MLHQQRVQAELDEKKQKALDNYVETIDDDDTDLAEILKSLKQYVKALQKDRLHTVNHYKHLLDTDPEVAENSRPQMADHLRGIDQHLTDALSMLNRVPKYKNKIIQQIQDHLDSYHSIDRSVSFILLGVNNPRTTTATPKPEVAEDDEGFGDDEDDDDDEDDEEEKEKKKKDEEGKEDEEDEKPDAETVKPENEETDDNDDDDDDDDDEDSENESVDVTTSSVVMTTTSTNLPTTKSAVPAAAVVTREGEKKSKEESSSSSSDDADDYFHLKAADKRPIVNNIDNNDFAMNQAYIQKSPVSRSAASGFSAAVPLGIAVGGITVFVVIIVGVIMMRRRANARHHRPLQPLGSLDLEPAALATSSPEERHVASMQMNGYENPTYKYFEQNASA